MANEKRLIDANALKQMFDEREADDVEWYGGVHIVECFPADDAKEIVDKCPTVDAVEVVHGEWECENESWGAVRCSKCKGKALLEKLNGELLYVFSQYCPNCGAKMDGDGNV